jgi:hypothetical protein
LTNKTEIIRSALGLSQTQWKKLTQYLHHLTDGRILLEYKPSEVSKLESANPLVGLGIPTRHIGDTYRHDFEGNGTFQQSKWWYASLIEVLVNEVDKCVYLCPDDCPVLNEEGRGSFGVSQGFDWWLLVATMLIKCTDSFLSSPFHLHQFARQWVKLPTESLF